MLTQNPIIPPPPLRNRDAVVDLAGFFNLVQEAFALHIKTTAPPNGITPTLVESFPKQRLSEPDTNFSVITYRLSNSVMAATQNNGTAPRGPSLRQNKQSQDKSDYNVLIYGWWEQVIVTFEIWTKDNSDANSLAIWFHKFMMTWAFAYKFFEGRGISNFAFLGREEDKNPRGDEQETYLRELSYTFRLETLVAFEQRQLTNLTITLDSPGTAPINLPAINK